MKPKAGLLIILYLCISFAPAQVNYVAITGNDSAVGSLAAPWRHIQFGMDNIQPGHTLMVLTGNYNEALQLNVSGTASAGIIVRGVGEDSVFVDGTGLNADNLLLIDGRHYVSFAHLHFQNNVHNYAAGITIQDASTHILIDSCKISQISFSANSTDSVNSNTNVNPVVVYGDNVTATGDIVFSHCEVYDCRTGFSEAVSFDGNVDSFLIANNVVHDITNIGIDMEGHYGVSPDTATDHARNGNCFGNLVYNCASPYAAAAGIYADGAYNCAIARNKVYNCQWGIEVGCETVGQTTSNIDVNNNFLWNNQLAGIAFGGYDYPTGSGKITNCVFYNNSTYNNDTYQQGNGELAITYAEDCAVRNNIFYCSAQNQLMYSESGAAQGVGFDYNCWYSLAGAGGQNIAFEGNSYTSFLAYQTATLQDAHAIFANPLFANPDTSAADLHLSAGSPCLTIGDISPGAALGLVDIDSNSRIDMGKVDIGAHELSDLTSLTRIDNASHSIEIYPNPSNGYVTIHIISWNDEKMTLHLTDVLGRHIFNTIITAADTNFSLFTLSAGIYWWIVGDANCGETGRMVIR